MAQSVGSSVDCHVDLGELVSLGEVGVHGIGIARKPSEGRAGPGLGQRAAVPAPSGPASS